jgi:hypothetical protein
LKRRISNCRSLWILVLIYATTGSSPKLAVVVEYAS